MTTDGSGMVGIAAVSEILKKAILVLSLGVAVSFPVIAAEEEPGKTGVTAGAITAPPFEYVYGRDNGLTGTVVVTEDRHLRILDTDGRTVQEVRTGIRFPLAVYADRNGVIHIHGPAGEHLLVGYDRGLRLTAARRADGSGSPAVHSRAIGVYPDRSGNVYSLSPPGVVTYGSAGGYQLWERPLPSTIRDHVSDGAVLFLGLADGSIFGFFPDGEGELLARVPDGVTSLVVFDGSLWVFTETGRVYQISARQGTRNRSDSLRVEWSGDPGEGPPVIRFFGTHGIRKVVPAGDPVGADSTYSVRLEDTGRIVVADDRGRDTMVIQTPHPVRDITVLPRQHALFVEYSEWRFALIPLDSSETFHSSSTSSLSPSPSSSSGTGVRRSDFVLPEGVIQNSPSSSVRSGGIVGDGALAALAEATLQGGSVGDRTSLLENIRRRMGRPAMYGNVATSRSILEALVRESVTVPVGRNAPDVRVEAMRLLGRIGDRPSRAILSDAVRYDPVPYLSAAALVEATAGGIDDSRAILWGLQRFNGASGREREIIASALLQAVSRVVPDGQGRDSDLHREVLATIAAADLSRELRQRALSVGRSR